MYSWRNWSGLHHATPENIFFPETEEQLTAFIQKAAEEHKFIRTVGSAHSFTPLVKSNSLLVSLDKMQGLIDYDIESLNARLWAGTKLYQAGEILFEKGMAMENMGDIDRQSLAGIISTGTHGTGVDYGTISTQVEELTFINGLGEKITCSLVENPEIFRAAAVSLGVLGVITRIKFKLVPSYKLTYSQSKESLSSVLTKLENYNSSNRNFEFYFFPHTGKVQTKFINETNLKPQKRSFSRYLNDVILENLAFKGLSEYVRIFPKKAPQISNLCINLVSELQKVNYSHKIFAVPRWVKFQEMEYNIPSENFQEAIQEVDEVIRKEKIQTHFPIECRFVKKDNLMLSPATGRDSAYIAVHQYKGMEYESYFRKMEEIFLKYNGRPHWGKLHFLEEKDFSTLYPEWDTFKSIREKMDPNGLFLSPYMTSIFKSQTKSKVI
ncbi:MAG: FAD-binding protein [Chitinophagaceae bacterium]|nr:MAG: FAD-binding protein [Chitinophagaceae bacterium]